MGCNIRAHIEISKNDGKTWELAVENVMDGRDYHLFAIMAGVRGRVPKITKNGLERAIMRMWGWPRHYGSSRGLPNDTSEATLHLFSCCDNHSESWGDLGDVEFWRHLDIQQQQDNVDWSKTADPDYKPSEYLNIQSMLTIVVERMKKQENVGRGRLVRLVFWFDS